MVWLINPSPHHSSILIARAIARPAAGIVAQGRHVVDAPEAGVIGSTLNTLALLPDVYSASLVFHALDATT